MSANELYEMEEECRAGMRRHLSYELDLTFTRRSKILMLVIAAFTLAMLAYTGV
jgi:hypothetical protein